MKKIIYFLFFVNVLFAKEYFSKVEPFNIYTIASEVNGKVIEANEELLGKVLTKIPFIRIDSELDRINLKATKQKLVALSLLIEASQKTLKNLQTILHKKEDNYNRIKNLKVKSQTQKDSVFYDIVATKNQILATKKEIQNYNSQIADLKAKKAQLQKSIRDKTIAYPQKILYALLVKKGEYVTPAKPLAQVADISKAILTIYVDASELENIKEKTIYIDGKKTSYKISRIIPIADSVNLSKYKVQIIINPPKIFSKLVKVELK